MVYDPTVRGAASRLGQRRGQHGLGHLSEQAARTGPLAVRLSAFGYPPSVTRMIVLPDTRRSGANADGASASGRTVPTVTVSRPQVSSPDERLLRADHAELVTLRVSQHNPGLCAGLPDIDPARSERQKALDLLVTILGAGGQV
jgi:hypothetical protein